MFRFAQHDTAERRRQCSAPGLLEQRPARFFKRRVANHDVWVWIRRARVVHSLHAGRKSRIFRLRRGNIHWSADFHQRKEFRGSLALQPNTTVGARHRMDKALVKTVGRSEFTPITHRISNIPARSATSRRNYPIALDAKSVRPRALMLLFGIDSEITSRCRLIRHTNRNGGRHQAAIAFHYINIFLGKRDFHAHGRRIMRLVRSDVIGPPRADPASRCTTSKQQERTAGTQQN
jgi:hypothetical protein